MRHATPLDAFNAAAGFSQQALGYADQELRRHAEIQFQHDALEETRESQLFLQTLELTGDDDNLTGKWEEFRDRRRANAKNKASGIRATPYYQKAVENMLGQNEVRMEAQVRGRQIELMQANGRATFMDSLELARKNNEGNPQAFIDEAHGLIRTAVKNSYISYPESLKLKNDIYDNAANGEIDRQVWAQFESGKTISDLEEIFKDIDLSKLRDFSISPIRNQDDKNYAETLRAKPSLTTEEADFLRQFDEDVKNDTEGYEEKQALLFRRNEALKNAGKERARQTWNGYITGKQKENVAAAAVTYGDALLAVSLGLPGARDMVLNGLAQIRNFQNPYFAENDRTEYNEKYNRLLKAMEEGAGSGGGRGGRDRLIKDLEEEFENARYLIQMGSVLHKDGVTWEQGLQAFKNIFYDKAMASGLFNSRADAELQFAKTLRFDEWMGELSNAIKTVDKEFQPRVMGRIKESVQLIAGFEKLNDSEKKMILDQTAEMMLGRIADIGMYQMTEEEWADWGTKIAETTVAGGLNLISVQSRVNNLSGLGDTQNQIRMIQEAKNNPDAIDTYGGRVRHMGNKENWDNYQEFVRGEIAGILGVDRGIARAGWVAEEGRQDSIIGLPMITITEGPKKGSYMQDVSGDGKKVVTLKFNEATGKYDIPIDDRTGEQITSDERKAQQQATDRARNYDSAFKMVNGRLDEILAEEDGGRRREEWETLLKSPEKDSFEDAAYLRGMDPRTLERLESISSERLLELLERNFGHRTDVTRTEIFKLKEKFPQSSRETINEFFKEKP